MTRTKIVVLLGAAALVAATGAGFAGDIRLGAHAGISVPDIRGSQTNVFSKNFTSRRGPYFGLTAEIQMARRLSLAVDLNYTSQGGIRKGMQPLTMDTSGLPVPPGMLIFADFRNETVLDYLEIPVMARVTFGDRLKFFLDLGPYAGYLVRGKASTEGFSALYLDEAGTMPIIIPPATDPLIVDLGAETDVRDSLEKINAGIAGGAGFKVPLGPGDLVLEARFQLGLTTIQKNPDTDGRAQTGAVLVSLGYALPLRRSK